VWAVALATLARGRAIRSITCATPASPSFVDWPATNPNNL